MPRYSSVATGSIGVVLECIVGVASIASFYFLSCRVRVSTIVFRRFRWCFSAGEPIHHLLRCSFRLVVQSKLRVQTGHSTLKLRVFTSDSVTVGVEMLCRRSSLVFCVDICSPVCSERSDMWFSVSSA